jgi:hypothetical protein
MARYYSKTLPRRERIRPLAHGKRRIKAAKKSNSSNITWIIYELRAAVSKWRGKRRGIASAQRL